MNMENKPFKRLPVPNKKLHMRKYRKHITKEIELARATGEAATLSRLAGSDLVHAAHVYREAFGKTHAETHTDFYLGWAH